MSQVQVVQPEAAREGAVVRVQAGGGPYDILIGRGLLGAPDTWRGLPQATSAIIVSNPTVAEAWGDRLHAALSPRFATLSTVLLPDGELHKDWPALNLIFEHLLSHGADRGALLFALGGGVVGDMTGFAAGCYMRGIPFVQVPTTLLAQVDSSVGGKTAINHALGKNMIGLFHQPRLVVCDLATLDTLPQREFVAGMAELIKYGPIADAGFMVWIESHLEAMLSRDDAALGHAIRRSCEIKAAVVGQDERESGLRAILNFGHTFGHAIEAGLGYGQWLHGEAVGCGMRMATDLSVRLGLVPPETLQRMHALLIRAGLPTRAPDLGLERYMELMGRDKKARGGEIRFVVLEALGRAALRKAPEAVVAEVIAQAVRVP